MDVKPGPWWEIGSVNRAPPASTNRANPVIRMVVVPNIWRDSRGGSDWATVGDKSRRLLSRMMFSTGLRRRENDMFSAYPRSRWPAAADCHDSNQKRDNRDEMKGLAASNQRGNIRGKT